VSAPTRDLPARLYRAASVRALDREAIEGCAIPGATLMERAGAAVCTVLEAAWPAARRVSVFCGTGNNGGDGFVVARRVREAGGEATVVQLGDAARLAGDARLHAERAAAAGVHTLAPERFDPAACDVIVDALLGTGLERAVQGAYRTAIEAVNAAARPVIAVDVPSGLAADTGQVLGAAVRAAATVTFIGVKRGLLTGAAADHCGQLWFADLDLPAAVYAAVPADAERIDLAGERAVLAPRPRAAHKGRFGHVLVVGGERGYAGAARMAAEAAARTGAGLVSVATREEHAGHIAAARPELMAQGVEHGTGLAALARRASVLALGPGLGQASWGRALFAAALEIARPMVVDADALNLLAADPLQRPDWILTPHPGEAARLLGTDTGAVQADRFAAAAAIRRRYGGVCVLKGAGTVVAAGSVPAVCAAGNPGMASGGMGDVLTGIVAGLLAQGLAPAAAARLGVCLHAAAGDAAAADGERGLLATDLLAHLRRLLDPPRP